MLNFSKITLSLSYRKDVCSSRYDPRYKKDYNGELVSSSDTEDLSSEGSSSTNNSEKKKK